MTKKITVSGVGCCLVDYLFNNISFTSDTFLKYHSKENGDGGLTPGQLVFAEEFENYAGHDFQSAIREITSDKPADKINVGGPGIVALIHAAQMLENTGCTINFYGGRGRDETGEFLRDSLKVTPVNVKNYRAIDGPTPSTFVLSDPHYNEGTGERVFINSIGAAGNYLPELLDEKFFSSDVVVFGGTALVPEIHENLTELLARAKSKGCITIVNTVFDFKNQKANPDKKWPLGKSDDSYHYIDLLITNYEEALRLSGESSLNKATEFFETMGTGAVVVTHGAHNITLSANKGSIFQEVKQTEMPVSELISKELIQNRSGDTTGCGDNFAGGMIASLVMQLKTSKKNIDLQEACIWGIISGGFSCFYMGGTYHQTAPGEKRSLIDPYYKAYLKQTSNG